MRAQQRIQTADSVRVFGVFLLLLGGVGYLTHPENALGVLTGGLFFGALCLAWGIFGARGIGWSWLAAVGTVAFLVLTCGWRAIANWRTVASGDSERAFTAALMTLVAAASCLILGLLLRDTKTEAAHKSNEVG